jgi:hypothetical protein
VSWERLIATHAADADDFANFQCWNGDRATPWIEEVENYVRVSVLRAAVWSVAFRDEKGKLAAVAAFDPVPIEVPLCNPVVNPGWKLQVVAIRLEYQAQGHSQMVFRETFEAMREANPDRILVTASIHRKHTASLKACERVGIAPFLPKDEHYWIALGEVPASE